MEREKEILQTRVGELSDHLADQVARLVRSIRNMQLKKPPSVSESIDWARTLLALGVDAVTSATVTSQAIVNAAAKALASGSR